MKNTFLLPLFLFSLANVSIFSQQPSTTAVNSEVFINVTVTNVEGKVVAGLDKDVFTVSEGKETVEILSFIPNEPAEVLFMFDKSKQVSDFYRKSGTGNQSAVYHLLSRFMQSGDVANNYGLIAFRKVHEQILASSNDQNAVLAAIDALDALKMEGSTNYIDACYFGIEKLSQSNRKRRALILFIGGNNSDSKYNSKDLINLLKKNNISLYIVAVPENLSFADMNTITTTGQPQGIPGRLTITPNDKGLEMMAKFDELTKLTDISGGKSFFPRSGAEVAEIFSRIGNELQFQYTLGIKLNNTSSNKQSRRLKIKVKPSRGAPKVFVRNREEFFVN